jgi:hypothetical protein
MTIQPSQSSSQQARLANLNSINNTLSARQNSRKNTGTASGQISSAAARLSGGNKSGGLISGVKTNGLISGRSTTGLINSPGAFLTLNRTRNPLQRSISTLSGVTDLVSKSKSTLDKIRDQLKIIRASASADKNGTLTGKERAANQKVINTAIQEIQRLATNGKTSGERVSVGPSAFGTNSDQVVAIKIDSIEPNASVSFSGSVAAAEAAELVYDGTKNSGVFDTATFTLSSSLGSAQITISKDESLSDVADRINQVTSTTGVTATVDGDRLIFNSADTGSDASFSTVLNFFELTVSGVNDSQVDIVQVERIDPDASQSLDGSVITAAEQGSQTYIGGAGGVIAESATFFLSGDDGNASISVTQGESLTDVADRINALTSSTGVTATVSGDNIELNTVNYGSDSSFSINFVGTDGLNDSQIIDFQIEAVDPNTIHAISGSVQEGDQAELKYKGDKGDKIKRDATITIAGDLGSVEISVSKGEKLVDVADRINQQTASTGVTATADGKNLFFNSVDRSSSSFVSVDVESGTFDISGGENVNGARVDYGTEKELTVDGQTVVGDGNQFSFSDAFGSYTLEIADGFTGSFDTFDVISASNKEIVRASGVNSSQIDNVEVNSIGFDTTQTISGSVDIAAEQATLKYKGDKESRIKEDATITVAGDLGSVEISVIRHEQVSDVADRINQQTALTGVTATVDGKNLYFSSVDYGSSSQVFVDVTSGKFKIEGCTDYNGGKIDYGKDVEATLNGVSYVGDGNQVVYTNGSDSVTLDFVAGFQGTVDTITIESIDAFELTGGNGNGTSTGVDVQAVINGETITGDGKTISFSNDVGSFVLEFTDGFTGSFDQIDVVNTTGTFDLNGGNDDGTADGLDVVVVINNQTLTAEGNNSYSYNDATTSFTVELADGFSGTLDTITVSGEFFHTAATLASDPTTSLLSFGKSNDLQGLAAFSLPSVQARSLGGPTGTLDQLAAGGLKSGLGANASDAIRIVDEALAQLDAVESQLGSFADLVTGASSALSNLSSVDEAKNASLSLIKGALANSGFTLGTFQQDRTSVFSLLSS